MIVIYHVYLPATGLFVEHVFHGVPHCAANYQRYHGARVALNASCNLWDMWHLKQSNKIRKIKQSSTKHFVYILSTHITIQGKKIRE